MRIGIIRFPGSNCDYDAYQAVVETLGEDELAEIFMGVGR